MIGMMKQRLLGRLLGWSAALLSVLSAPAAALAQDDEKPIYDARLEGYEGSMTLDSGGTGLTWLLLMVLAALCLGVLFKNAGRSHLD
jgi:hypothetical protein